MIHTIMPSDTLPILAIYAGIGLLYAIFKFAGVQLRYGTIGLILIIQPVAMSIYSDFDPRIMLGCVVGGVVILVFDVRRSQIL